MINSSVYVMIYFYKSKYTHMHTCLMMGDKEKHALLTFLSRFLKTYKRDGVIISAAF